MKIIYKFPLHLGITSIKLEENAEILTAAMQTDQLTLWVKLDPDTFAKELPIRTFVVYGTGQVIEDTVELKFITTVFTAPFVWHVFEQLNLKQHEDISNPL